MSLEKETAIALFAKTPQFGAVKTRLAIDIGAQLALDLHIAFLQDLIGQLKEIEQIDRYLYLTTAWPIETIKLPEVIADAIADQQLTIRYQVEGDLGLRMQSALSELFAQGYRSGIIIGSDSPDLPIEWLIEAVEALEDVDCVIVPTDDGGYCLIGARREVAPRLAQIFADIPWSTDKVYSSTITKLEQTEWRIFCLMRWYDIDTLADLKRLIQSLQALTDQQIAQTFRYTFQVLQTAGYL